MEEEKRADGAFGFSFFFSAMDRFSEYEVGACGIEVGARTDYRRYGANQARAINRPDAA